MRQIILKRIQEVKDHEGGFRKGTMKWDNFSTGTIKTHISEFDFNQCSDEELVFLFERVIKRYYSQM